MGVARFLDPFATGIDWFTLGLSFWICSYCVLALYAISCFISILMVLLCLICCCCVYLKYMEIRRLMHFCLEFLIVATKLMLSGVVCIHL